MIHNLKFFSSSPLKKQVPSTKSNPVLGLHLLFLERVSCSLSCSAFPAQDLIMLRDGFDILLPKVSPSCSTENTHTPIYGIVRNGGMFFLFFVSPSCLVTSQQCRTNLYAVFCHTNQN